MKKPILLNLLFAIVFPLHAQNQKMVDSFVRNLMKKMTLEEKIRQLHQVAIPNLFVIGATVCTEVEAKTIDRNSLINFSLIGPDGFTNSLQFVFNMSKVATIQNISGLITGTYNMEVEDEHECKEAPSVSVLSVYENTILNCPQQITINACLDAIESVYDSYEQFVASGGNVISDCGVDTTTFRWAGDQQVNGIFCINIRRTYMIQDSCGSWVNCVQDIVVDDRKPPVMNCPPDNTLFGIPASTLAPFASYKAYVSAGGFASDECEIDEPSFMFVSEVSNGGKDPEIITRTYQISDICGNKTTCEQTIILNGSSLVNINCPPAFSVQSPADLPMAYNSYAQFVAAGGSASGTNGVPLDESTFTWEGDISDVDTCIRNYSIKNINGDYSACTQTISLNKEGTTGINKVNIIEVNVYPNPSANKITFTFNQNFDKLKVELLQLTGACVFESEISSNESINIEKLKNGVYLYRLSDKNEVLNSGKIVVE